MSKSPSPFKKPEPNRFEVVALCDFFDALRAIKDGERIANQKWGDGSYAMMRDAQLQIYLRDEPDLEDGWHTWIISEADLTGEDYVIL